MHKLLVTTLATASLTASLPTPPQIPPATQQLMVVTTADWQAVPAELRLYERPNADKPWTLQPPVIPAVVGQTGMGWGRGHYDPKDAQGHLYRQQGDKRSPAGMFTLSEAFGRFSKEEAQQKLALKWPYVALNSSYECIGDRQSRYYNEVLDTRTVKPDWKTGDNEDMWLEANRDERAYEWGLIIDHNLDKNPHPDMKRLPGAGACIFMHIWKKPDKGTAGCTAMSTENMQRVLKWMEPAKSPVLVQLPQAEYLRLQKPWVLPAL